MNPGPDQINEHGQVVDEAILKKDRLRFGICTILDRSEESSMGGVPSVLIRGLGGNESHVGLFYTFLGLSSFSQWLGALILQRTRSNQKAMIISMLIGAFFAALIVAAILVAAPGGGSHTMLWCYLILSAGFSATVGIQMNIETSWIGDLVPRNKLGWFNSFKTILTCLGMMGFSLVIGRWADASPTFFTYAGIYGLLGFSFLWAAFIFRTITDRAPKNATFVSKGVDGGRRMDYTCFPMWCYIAYFFFWSGSRTAFFAFIPLYLIDEFDFSMTGIAWLSNAQIVTSLVLLHFFGKIGDRMGSRIPLILVSGVVAFCLSLWIGSAWLGVVPVIVFMFINGGAGSVHGMLSTNLALEYFPDKGRAAYIAFSRLCIGVITMAGPFLGGTFLHFFKGLHFQLWGAMLNNYHLLFAVCMVMGMCSVIPLLILGRFTRGQSADVSEVPQT